MRIFFSLKIEFSHISNKQRQIRKNYKKKFLSFEKIREENSKN